MDINKKYEFETEVEGISVERTNDSKYFRFSFRGTSMELPRDFLYQIIVLYGLPKQQEDMVVVTNKKMRTVRRQLRIKAKKDIKEGEDMVVEIGFPVEESIADKIESFKINK
jgi:SET domain-containing protein